MIYRKNDRVAASMCDGATKLSVLALFRLEQDAVTELMGELRIDGITAMREYDAIPIISRSYPAAVPRSNAGSSGSKAIGKNNGIPVWFRYPNAAAMSARA